jgi:O-antigen/teichoic acid export membrane protein
MGPGNTTASEAAGRPSIAEPGSPVRRILPDSPIMLTLVAKSAEALTLIALATVVPRALGPADYGLFAVVLAVVGIVSMSLSLGGPLLLSRFVPAAPAAERNALALALAVRIARFRALMVVAAIGLVVALATVVPERFPTEAALFVSIALALDVAATLIYQVALALGRRRLWSFRFPLQNTLLVVAALALHATAGVNGAIAAVAIASGGALLVGVPVVARQLRPTKPLASLPPGALRFGILQGVSGFFVQITLRGNVPLVLLVTGDKAEAGFAAFATGLVLAATYAVWQVFTIEFPRLSARADAEPASVEAAVRRLARTATLVLMPASLAGVLLAGPVLPFVLGRGFSGVEQALVPALAALPFAGLTALATQVSALRLRSDIRVRITAVGAGVFLVAAVVAVPEWGAVGGTAAFLAGTAATVFAAARQLPGVFERPLVAVATAASVAVVMIGAFT